MNKTISTTLIAAALSLSACNSTQKATDEYVDFLYSTMLTADSLDYPRDFYVRNTELALETRNVMPWGAKIPEREFKNFVLPVIVLFLTQGLMTACMTEIIRYGYAVDKASVASVAMSIEYLGMAIGTIVLGPMSDKKEPKVVAAVALLFVALGSAIMLLINENSGILQMGGALFFVGLGLGGNTTIFMKVALSGVAPTESSSASGTFNVFKDMCAPFGVAIFVPMFVTGMAGKAASGMAVPAAATSALHTVALVQLVCVLVGIFVCFLLPTVRAKAAEQA